LLHDFDQPHLHHCASAATPNAGALIVFVYQFLSDQRPASAQQRAVFLGSSTLQLLAKPTSTDRFSP
jgi:hypothetical protein